MAGNPTRRALSTLRIMSSMNTDSAKFELETLAQVLVDRGLRLQQLDGRRDDDAVEDLEEIVAPVEISEDRRRHVRQAVELEPAGAELAQQRHRGLDRLERRAHVVEQCAQLGFRPRHARRAAAHDARFVERAAIHVEPIVVLKRVGAQRFAQLRLGIERVDDLLRPPRHEDAAEIEDHVANGHARSTLKRRAPRESR